MWVIASTLLVYLVAFAAVFGTQFAAVVALMSRRAGTFDPGRGSRWVVHVARGCACSRGGRPPGSSWP
jgi:hypothetical protein